MRSDPQWERNDDVRLHPDSVAKAYKYLVEQDSSALTWELDRTCRHRRDRPDIRSLPLSFLVRPAHEKW